MSPPLLGVEGGQSTDPLSVVLSPTSEESCLKEHNYFGLSDCSSVDSSTPTSVSLSQDRKDNLNLKATELRLGLPGSLSPERGTDPELCLLSSSKLDEKLLFPLTPLKNGASSSMQKATVSGSKRRFSGNMDKDIKVMLSSSRPGGPPAPSKDLHESTHTHSNNNSNAPAAKAQVVGWPPIRSFRKNTLASARNNDPIFVKVSMDGAPYLRKVDLKSYTCYQELSSGLEKMFSCFTLGECGAQGAGRENLSEIKLKDLQHGSENVLTYEDKDGDWMLVGDVPWEMFIDSCKRLKIMKSSDAIGLAPRVMEKSKSRS